MVSPGFMVLSSRLVVHLPDAEPGPEWVRVECASKEAYGCGKLDEKLLMKGLTLYVLRLGHLDLSSFLSIGLTYEALWSIEAKLGVPDHLQGLEGNLQVVGNIEIAKGQVLILFVVFRLRNLEKSLYYLVYDAKDASLYMIPYIPGNVEASFSMTPVPARPGGGRGHELVLAAQRFWPQPGSAERGRLCVCTPATRANTATDSTGPWEIKVHRFPDLAFSADVMFSSEDKVFWADLSLGVAYSDLRSFARATRLLERRRSSPSNPPRPGGYIL